MAVPAPGKMADLRPGIGVEVVVAVQAHTGAGEQAPEVDQIGAHQHGVGRQFGRLAPRQTIRRLIDTDHEMLRKHPRQMQGAPANAAAGVENQRRGAVPCGMRGQCRGQSALVIGSKRLAQRLRQMPAQQFFQIGVYRALRTADRTRVSLHQAPRQ